MDGNPCTARPLSILGYAPIFTILLDAQRILKDALFSGLQDNAPRPAVEFCLQGVANFPSKG
jgi:hypothetical protein